MYKWCTLCTIDVITRKKRVLWMCSPVDYHHRTWSLSQHCHCKKFTWINKKKRQTISQKLLLLALFPSVLSRLFGYLVMTVFQIMYAYRSSFDTSSLRDQGQISPSKNIKKYLQRLLFNHIKTVSNHNIHLLCAPLLMHYPSEIKAKFPRQQQHQEKTSADGF